MLKFIFIIVGISYPALCQDEPSDLKSLYTSIINSPNIQETKKQGLKEVLFWHDIHLQYPSIEAEIPELHSQMNQLTDGITAQIHKFYGDGARDALLIKVNQFCSDYHKMLGGKFPTRQQWYRFCIELSHICSINTPSQFLQEIETRTTQLAETGFIVGFVFPTCENPTFDGTIGEAAVVAGLLNNVWLAGFSIRPDLRVQNPGTSKDSKATYQKVTPHHFLWYQICADSLGFIIKHKSQHQLYQQKLMKLLEQAPTNQNYLDLFEQLLYVPPIFEMNIEFSPK